MQKAISKQAHQNILKRHMRRCFKSYYDLKYMIRIVEPTREQVNKQLFVETLKILREIEDRTEFLEGEIGMGVTGYDDKFFTVIENLMKMHFSKEQLALIQMYLYQLLPDKEWDGKITVDQKGKEIEYDFKTPENVWDVISTFK